MNPNSNSVASDLLASATTGRISDVSGSPNKFLYIGNVSKPWFSQRSWSSFIALLKHKDKLSKTKHLPE